MGKPLKEHTPVFSGPIATQLAGFLEEKRALGYKYNNESWRLLQIDELSKETDNSPDTLSQELMDAWWKRTPFESDKTWYSRITIMKQLSKYFVARDLPCVSPPVFSENFRVKSTFTPYIFTHDEMKRILQAADTIVPPAYRPNRGKTASLLFRVLYSCGLRVGEALSLTVQDVDLDRNILTVKNGKGKVDRYVPMSEELSSRCRIYTTDLIPALSETDFFFSAPDGGKYSHTAVSGMWSEILRKANIPKTDNGPRIHDLRHTFCVHCLKRWVDNGENVSSLLPVLSSYLGHVHLSSVNRYLRLTADVYPDITKAVERYLGNIVPDGGNVYEEE